MYIYIDTKFSYDNNVYFSIFCEHRQLKHGMHVIDPSREVSSHCMTVQVATSGYKCFFVVKSGVMWFYVAKWGKVGKSGESGEKLEKVGKSGERWEKWGKVGKSGEKLGKVGKVGKS